MTNVNTTLNIVAAKEQVLHALSAREFGDARSLLDEHFHFGNFSEHELSNDDCSWHFHKSSGWHYVEHDNES